MNVNIIVKNLLLFFIIFIFIIFPLSFFDYNDNFPINDDWAYFTTLRWLYKYHVLKFTNWQYMTLVSQTMLGLLWANIFGLSYHALRNLSVLTALVGAVAVQGLTRAVAWPLRIVTLATIILNPIIAVHSLTFMTDVYFWMATAWAVLLLERGLEFDNDRHIWIGWLCLTFAVLVRQTGLGVGIAFVVADLIKNGFQFKLLRRGVLPILLIALLLIGLKLLVAKTIGLPGDFEQPTNAVRAAVLDLAHGHAGALQPLITGSIEAIVYMGVFALPLIPFLLWTRRMILTKNEALGVIGLSGALFLAIFVMRTPVLSAKNILSSEGLGPRLIEHNANPIGWPSWILTGLGCVAAGIVIWPIVINLIQSIRSHDFSPIRSRWRPIFLILSGLLIYIPMIVGYSAWFDRHLIVPFTFIIIGVVSWFPYDDKVADVRFAVLMASLYFCVTSALVHDFFAWQRARWVAISALESRGIQFQNIDGGFEYNNIKTHSIPPQQTLPKVLMGPQYGRSCGVSDTQAEDRKSHVLIARWLPLGHDRLYYGCKTKAS